MENSLKNMCKAFLSNQTCVHCKGTPNISPRERKCKRKFQATLKDCHKIGSLLLSLQQLGSTK